MTAESRVRFTPGPWAWHTSNSWRRLKRDGHGMTMNVLEPFVHWRDHHPDCTVSEEDMALIAAAPELYEAAEVLLALLETDAAQSADEGRPYRNPIWLECMQRARDALAKARGEGMAELLRDGENGR